MSDDNVFAPPQDDVDPQWEPSDHVVEDLQRLLYCLKPLLSAAPWIIISAVSLIIMIGVMLRQMFALGMLPVVISLFPLAAAIALAYAAVHIRRGAKNRNSRQIHKGCVMLKVSMMIFAILILVYIGFIFTTVLVIGR